MECKDVLANLSNYVDGEVSAKLRAALEEHVEVPLAVSARLYTRPEKVLSGGEDIGILPGRVVS